MADLSTIQHITNKARKDKFLMVFALPRVLRDENSQLLSARTPSLVQADALQYSIWGAVVPKISAPSHMARFAGQTYKVTGQSRQPYEPITVNFTIDNMFTNYWILWKWMDKINKIRDSGMDEHFNDDVVKASKGALDGNKFTDYQTNLTVYAKDEYNTSVVQINYYKAFITDLGGIDYNYRNESELETTVTFDFSQMDIKLMENGLLINQ